MAFAMGPISFRRFFIVSGRVPDRADGAMAAALKKRAFAVDGASDPDGVHVGWVSPEHLFDTDITADKVAYDHFAYFQMRLDRTAPPPAVVRGYVQIEEAAAREAAGKDFLNKAERKAARELAQAKAEKEAKAGLFRRVSAIPVLIDLSARVVYFGHLGSDASDKFITLFHETFDLGLEAATSDQLAFRIMNAAGDPRAVEDAEPFHLVPPPVPEADDDFDALDRAFFGREFLTWLWYKTDGSQGSLDGADRPLSVLFARMMHLDCDYKMTGSVTVRCEGPAAAREAREALRIGKQPTKAGLVLSTAADEFTLLLDGPRFTVSGLRLPDSDETDPRANLEERFRKTVEAAGWLDMLYGLFLGARAGNDWPRELTAMKRWAAGPAVATRGKPERTLALAARPGAS